MITKHYRTPKTLLKKSKFVSSYFVSKYSFSPYMACEHGCVYCDGRAEKYYVEGDFEKDIVVRSNTVKLLQKELINIKETGTISIGSGISDVYAPIEKEEQITRKCAEVLLQHNCSAYIMTKSDLILRDIDLWDKLNQKNRFTLVMSLTTLNESTRKIFEPNASSIEERLKTIEAFKKRNIPVGISAMPFLPYITDTEEQLEPFLNKLKSLDIDFILPADLTLRPGKQKEFFLDKIKTHYPHLLSKYLNLYSENRQSGAMKKSYSKEFTKRMDAHLKKQQIPEETPHYIYKKQFPIYDEIHILLDHMTTLYERNGINTAILKASLKRYENWLGKEKSRYSRKQTFQTELENKLQSMILFGDFAAILKNDKLFSFIKDIVINDKTLNYSNLKIY